MQEDFNPLVSIVIPVYNGSNYMREAIDSALAQTYPNIEVIVVNDGSTDNTDEIAKSYGNKIRYFIKENGGVSTALNLAIENMNGEYFSWLSHDDMYLPEKIESQIHILRSLKDKTTVIYGGYRYIDEKGGLICEVKLDNEFSLDDLNKPLFSLLLNRISGCALLIHKMYFQTVGLFDETLRITQDYDLWFRILQNAGIYYDTHCLTLSRIHQRQTGKTPAALTSNEESLFWERTIKSIPAKKWMEIFPPYMHMELYKNLYTRFKDQPAVFTVVIEKYIECIGLEYSLSKEAAIEKIVENYFTVQEQYMRILNQSIRTRMRTLISDIIRKIFHFHRKAY